MPLQLFDRRAGSLAPFVTSERGHARVRPAPLGSSLTCARAEVLCDVLTRHLRAAGARVSLVTPQEPCDLELALEGAAQVGDTRLLELARVELADTDAAQPRHEELAALREPEALRYLLLTEHYRAPLRLSSGEQGSQGLLELERAEQQVAYLYASKRRLMSIPEARIIEVESKPPPAIGGFAVALAQALDADLDTPRALAETERFLRAINELCDHAMRKQGKLIRSQLDDAIFGLSSLAGRLGLGSSPPAAWLERVRDRRAAARGLSGAWVESKLRQRRAAREQKDFAGADAVRAELAALGVEIVDSPDGTSWSL